MKKFLDLGLQPLANSFIKKKDISWYQKKKLRDKKIIRNFVPSKMKNSKNLRTVYYNNIHFEK